MLVLKENVTGFIYESIEGRVIEIFNDEINVNDLELDEDMLLFTNADIDFINEMFTIDSKEDLESDSEGLNEVLNFI
jgi:hypothetical protein